MLADVSGKDIQLENGNWVRIHNAIFETLAKAELSPLEFRIVALVLRQTYGYNKKEDVISITQFEACGASRRATVTALQNLLRLRVLRREEHGQAFSYRFNKYVEEWLPEAFVSRHAGRAQNFKKGQTSEAVELVKPLGTSEVVDTGTSEPVEHQTSEVVDTHKRQLKTIKDNKRERQPKPHDARLDDPAVVLYRDICKLTPNDTQRDLICKAITDLDKWRETLTFWMGCSYKPGNVVGMIDRYRQGPQQPMRSNGHGSKATTFGIASEANREANRQRATIPADRTPILPAGYFGDGEREGMPKMPGSEGTNGTGQT